MSKKITISTKTKAEEIEALEKEFEAGTEKNYRFTAVLPEKVGQKLRMYCAERHLKMKHVFAQAVTDFINTKNHSPNQTEAAEIQQSL